MRLALLALVLVAACGKDKDTAKKADPPSAPERDKDIDDLIRRHGAEGIATVEAALKSGNPRPTDCVVLASIDELAAVDPALADKAKRLCNHDVPMALLEKGVPAAEAARAAKPDAVSLPACSDVDVMMGVETLEAQGPLDDAARALVARLDTACPRGPARAEQEVGSGLRFEPRHAFSEIFDRVLDVAAEEHDLLRGISNDVLDDRQPGVGFVNPCRQAPVEPIDARRQMIVQIVDTCVRRENRVADLAQNGEGDL
jgi:hypothetical protein